MNIINVKNVSKKFKINKDINTRDNILNRLKTSKPEKQTIWAIKNVSFSIKKGQWLGIIGENGSGKTTLLKIISGIMEPTEGKVETNANIASIIGLGTGFKDEFTAKENVKLYCSLMGLKEEEIKDVYNDIVSFFGLYEYMNTKFKKFSDGMKMRLAFSAAIHVNADILVSDEVLSVGDGEFQKKCLNKMKEMKEKGKTIVFVSHDLSSIKNWCDKLILLDNGEIKSKGNVDDVINEYKTYLKWKGKNENLKGFKTNITTDQVIKNVKFYNELDKESYVYKKGEKLKSVIKLHKTLDCKLKMNFKNSKIGNKALEIYTKNIEKKDNFETVTFVVDSLWLDEGKYNVSIETPDEVIFNKLKVEIIENENENTPQTILLKSPQNDNDFPSGQYYVFGKTDNLLERYKNGESMMVYNNLDSHEIKEKYGEATKIKDGEIVGKNRS